MNIKDSSITVNVKDLDKSIFFYESIGFTLKDRWDKYYALLSSPGLTIGLHPTDSEHLKDNSGNVSIGLTVNNFEETKSELQKLAINMTERKEEGGLFIHFKDPDGTALFFIKPKW